MSGEGFLSRWAKRKQESARQDSNKADAHEAVAAVPLDQQPQDATAVVVEAIDPVDPEAISPAELAALPPVEEIVDPAALSQYLRKGVPRVLRNMAMRRMWMLDPAIRDYVDPALDYAYDWNVPGGVPGNGPLATGFDAKGAAEKFFSSRRGKISMETGEFEGTESEVAEEAAAETIAAQGNADFELQRAASTDAKEFLNVTKCASDDSQNLKSDTDDAHPTLVVSDLRKIEPRQDESLAVQSPRRRHGRALPV